VTADAEIKRPRLRLFACRRLDACGPSQQRAFVETN
jgi:hypothetical protein